MSRLRPGALSAVTARCGQSESVAAAARAESAALAADELGRDLQRRADALASASATDSEEGLPRFLALAAEAEEWTSGAEARLVELELAEAVGKGDEDERLGKIEVSQSLNCFFIFIFATPSEVRPYRCFMAATSSHFRRNSSSASLFPLDPSPPFKGLGVEMSNAVKVDICI